MCSQEQFIHYLQQEFIDSEGKSNKIIMAASEDKDALVKEMHQLQGTSMNDVGTKPNYKITHIEHDDSYCRLDYTLTYNGNTFKYSLRWVIMRCKKVT